jgi:hypothetical protein
MSQFRTITLSSTFLLIFCWLILPTDLSAQTLSSGSKAAAKELQDMYMAYLAEMDKSPFVDQDGDVQFRHGGLTYFIDVDEGDTEYFAVMLPNSWMIESEAEKQRILEACNEVNATSKVVKAQIINDNVWFTTEVFLADPADFRAIFPRILTAISDATDLFIEIMGR